MKALIYKKKKKIFILRTNFKTQRSSAKLNHVRTESFLIKKKLEDNTYEIDLRDTSKKHLVFHVALLEKASTHAKLNNET
jgi:hypothetical protein